MPAASPATDTDLNAFLSPASFWWPENIQLSAWLQHGPFAFWLTQALAPRSIVELGTHRGYSYLAFCQAVKRLGLPTRCFAVDTWQGDEHAGQYSDQILQELRAWHDPRYADFSRLVRARFDQAAPHFADGSVDLLHVDGRHFYADAKEDYETWRPKLSQRAVVLFHDTNVRERDFGVWKLWAELAPTRPSFEFLHGHGLGVLGYGPDLPPALNAFFEAGKNPEPIRAIYYRLGGAIEESRKLSLAAKAQPPATPAAAPTPVAQKPAAPNPAPALHIHLAAMAPEFADARGALPFRAMARVPGVTTSHSDKQIVLPARVDHPKVAILQRLVVKEAKEWMRDIDAMIRRKNWLFVAEIDDHPELFAAVNRWEMKDDLWNCVRLVHAVQTSTKELADAIRPHNPHVAVFPNAAFELPRRPAPRGDGVLRVFYGALNREHFSAKVGAALAAFGESHPDVEFAVVHDKAFFEALGGAKKHFTTALSYEKYLALMGRCDVALMPLEGVGGEPFKSDVKFVESAARGLAVIASPSVYARTLWHGETGLIANTPEDFAAALARLHADGALRAALADNARAYVERERMFDPAPRLAWYRELWLRRDELNRELFARAASATRIAPVAG